MVRIPIPRPAIRRPVYSMEIVEAEVWRVPPRRKRREPRVSTPLLPRRSRKAEKNDPKNAPWWFWLIKWLTSVI